MGKGNQRVFARGTAVPGKSANMKIDFKEKKTEAGWQRTIDSFWKKATPHWFEWLEWVLVLGVITFLAEQTQSIVLRVVTGVSYVALLFYLQSIFFSLEFHGFPLIKSERTRRVVSLLLSAILSSVLGLLLFSLATQIQGKV